MLHLLTKIEIFLSHGFYKTSLFDYSILDTYEKYRDWEKPKDGYSHYDRKKNRLLSDEKNEIRHTSLSPDKSRSKITFPLQKYGAHHYI